MKLGGPWNHKGRRPRAHEPAQGTGPRSGAAGVSVGEWLNSVIQRSDDEYKPQERPRQHDRETIPFGAPLPGESGHREPDYGGRQGGPYRESSRDQRYPDCQDRQRENRPFRDSRQDARHERRDEVRSYRDSDYAEPRQPLHEDNLTRNVEQGERQPIAPQAQREARAEIPRYDEFDEVNARLDKLGQQLEHLARAAAAPQRPIPVEPRHDAEPPLTGAPTPARKPAGASGHPPVASVSRVREAPSEPAPAPKAASETHGRSATGAPPPRRRANAEPPISIDDAVAEIAARQRVLDGEVALAGDAAAAAEAAAAADESPTPEPAPGPLVDFASLEQLLRQITARIEALQPSKEIETAIAALRSDLAEIGKQLNEALPRRALDSLESEIKTLAARIDFSRHAGVDPNALAGLERGLGEVHEALRALTPAENLVGADEAVSALAQKVDLILARDDPAMMQQLEAAIGGLRGVVAHVASNDTLNKVAEDVRVLAAQVDAIANNAATAQAVVSLEQRIEALAAALQASSEAGHAAPRDDAANAETAHAVASLEQRIEALAAALQTSSAGDPAAPRDDAANAETAHAVAALEQRIDALTAALHASSEAGQAVPRDLEKLLTGLIDKLDWAQLTHTDHAALAHLEDRIAMLVKRFDASEARFTQLEGIERGLADLLIHVDQLRGASPAAAAEPAAAWQAPAAVTAFEEQAALFQQNEPRSPDRPEAAHDTAVPASRHDTVEPAALQDTVEHVADRLALIESHAYDGAAHDAPFEAPVIAEPTPAAAPQHAAAMPVVADEIISLLTAAPAAPIEAVAAAAPPAPQQAPRAPIDPSLPPDHPLEPGFTGSRSRAVPSAAERVAASEAAIGSAKPPVIPDAGRPNFIAAARRAAQAASWEPSTAKAKQEPEPIQKTGEPSKLSQRLRKLVVAGSALLIVVGCAHIALRLLDDGHPIGKPAPIQSQQIPAPPAPTPAPLAQKAPPAPAPAAQAPVLPLPDPAGAAAPQPAPVPAKTAKPEQQSLQQDGTRETLARETVAKATPPASAQPAANSLPAWATPDITGTLPRSLAGPAKPRAAAPAAIANDDDLPASMGDLALRAAALGGDPAAAYEIAARFAEGRGVVKNPTAAAHWLERAAKEGLAPAQFRLGGLYEKGIGVKKDLARARELYLAAAQKGNGKAMHNLAVLYAEGVDGTPDYTTAAEWFRRGADHGVSDSQYNLGILYARGIGVGQDYAESYKWFALAANQGDQDAAGKRDEVASHLDAKALAAARSTVQNFKPEPQPDEAINVKTAAASQPPANAK